MPALTDYDIPALEELLRGQSLPTVHARRTLRRLYETGGQTIAGVQIPRRFAELIARRIPLRSSRVLAEQRAADGTVKLLVGFAVGQNAADRLAPLAEPNSIGPVAGPVTGSVECVLMPSHRADRTAGCLSSQVGCAMGCDFCASTRAGLERNLSAGEIVEQFLHLRRLSLEMGRRLVTIVFMGMGEPLLNFDNVSAAIRRIAGDELGALGWRQVTVSTVGIVPGIERLAHEKLRVQLAVSLHAPDDATRVRIVPAGRKYRVAEILDAADAYQRTSGRIVNIEYCMLGGVNDSIEQAHLLGKLLARRRMHVNLIRYNPTGAGISGQVYQSPTDERMSLFARILGEHRIVAHFRQARGQDIDGACGQLKQRAASPTLVAGDSHG